MACTVLTAGSWTLTAYVPLTVLGWYYVVEADPEVALGGAGE